MFDMIVLEQFTWDLEEHTQKWVKQYQSGTLKDAVKLADAFTETEEEVPRECRARAEAQPSTPTMEGLQGQ